MKRLPSEVSTSKRAAGERSAAAWGRLGLERRPAAGRARESGSIERQAGAEAEGGGRVRKDASVGEEKKRAAAGGSMIYTRTTPHACLSNAVARRTETNKQTTARNPPVLLDDIKHT